MANREELGLIRGARAGRAEAQLELGKLYLFGSSGLPKSLPTALHWLDRAAKQQSLEACSLIGTHIPLEVAQASSLPLEPWYERAYDAGVGRAGLVLAQLILAGDPLQVSPGRRAKAIGALEAAARAGHAEAQCLLARYRTAPASVAPGSGAVRLASASGGQFTSAFATVAGPAGPARAALARPLSAAVSEADHALLEAAWDAHAWSAYLQLALPLARQFVARLEASPKLALRPGPNDVVLLSRCARLLAEQRGGESADPDEVRTFFDIAATEHDRHAELAVGLWYARMQVDGKRIAVGAGSANFKKAIRWLTLAGEQGLAEAWYALSRIYIKPEFSQRNVADAQRYLERAAEMGFRDAQLECGSSAWRARRENENNDVRAVYWLQKAALQGSREAAAALDKIAPRGQGATYGWSSLLAPRRELPASHPLLAARLELAAIFHLSRAEALLLDVRAADQGHCLIIDIRASYGRSKRRLVTIANASERHALDRIGRLFEHVDCGPQGPEGNYRQRLYRLKTLVPEALEAVDEREADVYEMAA